MEKTLYLKRQLELMFSDIDLWTLNYWVTGICPKRGFNKEIEYKVADKESRFWKGLDER